MLLQYIIRMFSCALYDFSHSQSCSSIVSAEWKQYQASINESWVWRSPCLNHISPVSELLCEAQSSDFPSNRGYCIGVCGRSGKRRCVLHLTENLFSCDTALSDTKWPEGSHSNGVPGIKGIKSNGALKPNSRINASQWITPVLLNKLFDVWERGSDLRNFKMLWAASCLTFFAFLRVGEFTGSQDNVKIPQQELVNNHNTLAYLHANYLHSGRTSVFILTLWYHL